MPPRRQSIPNGNASSDLLSRREAAEYLGVSEQTLAIWRCSGRYQLPVIKVGRLAKYRRRDLESFLASRTQTFEGDSKSIAISGGKALPPEQSIGFAELKLVERKKSPSPSAPVAADHASLELVLPNGIKLRVNSVELLPAVLAMLEKQ
jgi:hypothetical protein